MTFTTSLFRAIDRADHVTVAGYLIDEFCQVDGVMRCTCDEDNEWSFRNQDIEVGVDGSCNAIAFKTDINGQPFGHEILVTVDFSTEHSLTSADMA